ncbi:MAG: peptidoglycan-binding domain-containing protein [Archangium sp.]
MTLRIGSRGAPVSVVQTALNERGAHLDVDSRYGRRTASAVREFQREHHLRVDGRVGPETARALGLSDGFDAGATEPARTRRGGGGGGAPRASSAGDGFDTAPATRSGGRPATEAPSRTAPATPSAPPPEAPDARTGPLLSPAEMDSLSEVEQVTLGARRMNERLDSYTERGEPVPPEVRTRAQRLLDGIDSRMWLGAGDDGTVNDLATEAGGLRSRLAALD